MANFQESRFFGLSGKTLMVTVVIVALVVVLFFLPETIKFALKSGRQSGSDKGASQIAKMRKEPKAAAASSERGSLSPEALKAIGSAVGSSSSPSQQPAQVARRETIEEGDRGGLFSGWNFRVKAGGSGGKSEPAPPGLNLEKLDSKEFQTFFKQSQQDTKKFIQNHLGNNFRGEEVVGTFLSQVELAARESSRGMSLSNLTGGLQDLHISTIQALSRSGADRGVVLEWLKVPIVSFIDSKTGVNATKKVREYFVPRMVLRRVSVRQAPGGGWGADGRSPASLTAEVAYGGSDIERIVVYANGRQVTQVAGGANSRRGAGPIQTLTVNGDAQGVWTFVAYDRFGGPTYWKSYSFIPKVTRFRQAPNGEYRVAFKPRSAPNSLDRFFLVGSSALRQSADPMVSVF